MICIYFKVICSNKSSIYFGDLLGASHEVMKKQDRQRTCHPCSCVFFPCFCGTSMYKERLLCLERKHYPFLLEKYLSCRPCEKPSGMCLQSLRGWCTAYQLPTLPSPPLVEGSFQTRGLCCISDCTCKGWRGTHLRESPDIAQVEAAEVNLSVLVMHENHQPLLKPIRVGLG